MKFRSPIYLALVIAAHSGIAFSQSTTPSTIKTHISRPVDVWAARSVLDMKPRMLSIALHKNLWVAYSTETGSLYKAWAGGVNFEGTVYTAVHTVLPTSKGTTYMIEPGDNPWRLIVNKTELIPKVSYKGHTIVKNRITLKYELSHKGRKIIVEERPEYTEAGNNMIGFERRFTIANVPAGTQIGLKAQVASLISEKDLVTDGQFILEKKSAEQLEGKQYLSLRGTLVLNSNKPTAFYSKFSPKPAAVSTEKPFLTKEEQVLALIEKTDCATCHNKDSKSVGPSYMAIAEQYPNTPQNREMLFEKVIKGGSGNWGAIPMTPHPNLPRENVVSIVSYIMSLDVKEEGTHVTGQLMPAPPYKIDLKISPALQVDIKPEQPGIALNVYQFNGRVLSMPDISKDMSPFLSGSVNALHLGPKDFGPVTNNFLIQATGSINLPKMTKAVFRLVSDGGSRIFIDDKLVINNDGPHNLRAMESEIVLNEGKHPFRIEYFHGTYNKAVSLQWIPYGKKEFEVVPPELFTFTDNDIKRAQNKIIPLESLVIPGDTFPLESVHPSLILSQARPSGFQPRVGGMDFLPDGRLVVSTWDSVGAVYILDGVQGNKPEAIKVKRIAFGLAEPLGLKVVDNDIYIMQKHELTKLVDLDKDEIIDEYQTFCNGWKVSANFHEFAFGLVYKDGYFYGTLATAIDPGGASTQPQLPDRGKVIKISKADGSFSFVASGLRTPNGIGIGTDDEIFVADNQGDWLPANKIVHVRQGAWYGSRSVDFKGTENLKEDLPVVYLTQDEIARSPSQPIRFDKGPYKNQMLHGDITLGGINRIFVEKVNGEYQGASFRFTQGLEVGINRLLWGPDSSLYAGGVGMRGGWAQYGKLTYGIQKLAYNEKPAFEMLSVSARPNGIEIEFTEPLKEGAGSKASDYMIKQWWFKPTAEYGGPKMDETNLMIDKIIISPDRKKVLLELNEMKAKHVLYVRLNYKTIKSSTNRDLWSTETWYTMNSIPAK